MIARQGEQIIFNLLPGAIWANEKTEKGQSYDLEWQSRKIDVKTTLQKAYTSKKAFQFIDSSAIKKEKVIFVFVALYEGVKYFWVDSANLPKRAFYKKIADSISEEKLQQEILKY